MMETMIPSAQPRPQMPGASTRPQAVKPSVAWVYGGAGLALAGIIIGVTLVVVGFLSDGGPETLGRSDFPGQVEFSSPVRSGRLGIYLERSTMSGDPALPGYLDPIVIRGDGEVEVDPKPNLPRHAGMSTELIPIGSFQVVGGDYTVTVDPDGTLTGSNVSVVVADPNSDSRGIDLMLWGGIGGAVAALLGSGVVVGVGRARDRARVRALVQSRSDRSGGSS